MCLLACAIHRENQMKSDNSKIKLTGFLIITQCDVLGQPRQMIRSKTGSSRSHQKWNHCIFHNLNVYFYERQKETRCSEKP